jgi:hypothetical protein
MPTRPAPALRGLFDFLWDAADYLASAAQKRLGLWPVAVKPFLSRAEFEDLAGLVAFLEAILRRLFCLAALELGPLPAPRSTSHGAEKLPQAGARPPASRAEGHCAKRALPRFRLTETSVSSASTPPDPHYRTGPRIRFLDEDTPVDLRDYPTLPTDILPAGKLVRRLLAINHALDHAAEYIARLRRLMVSKGPVIKRAVPPAFTSRKLRHLQQESARQLHVAIWEFTPPDTS